LEIALEPEMGQMNLSSCKVCKTVSKNELMVSLWIGRQCSKIGYWLKKKKSITVVLVLKSAYMLQNF